MERQPLWICSVGFPLTCHVSASFPAIQHISIECKSPENYGHESDFLSFSFFIGLFFDYSDANFELERLFSFSHNYAILKTSKMEANYMPEISLFCGIRITMFYSDHNPPHFHAEYAGQGIGRYSGGMRDSRCSASTAVEINFGLG